MDLGNCTSLSRTSRLNSRMKKYESARNFYAFSSRNTLYKETSSVADRKYQRNRKSLNSKQYRYLDNCMAENKELTSRHLHRKLLEQFPAVRTSLSSVNRARRELGWVCKRTRYCGLITETNQEKRLKWCEEQVQVNDVEFSDVIFTD